MSKTSGSHVLVPRRRQQSLYWHSIFVKVAIEFKLIIFSRIINNLIEPEHFFSADWTRKDIQAHLRRLVIPHCEGVSVSLFVCVSACPLSFLPACLPVWVSVCLSVFVSVCLSVKNCCHILLKNCCKCRYWNNLTQPLFWHVIWCVFFYIFNIKFWLNVDSAYIMYSNLGYH